jgi:hypothetical protein
MMDIMDRISGPIFREFQLSASDFGLGNIDEKTNGLPFLSARFDRFDGLDQRSRRDR